MASVSTILTKPENLGEPVNPPLAVNLTALCLTCGAEKETRYFFRTRSGEPITDACRKCKAEIRDAARNASILKALYSLSHSLDANLSPTTPKAPTRIPALPIVRYALLDGSSPNIGTKFFQELQSTATSQDSKVKAYGATYELPGGLEKFLHRIASSYGLHVSATGDLRQEVTLAVLEAQASGEVFETEAALTKVAKHAVFDWLRKEKYTFKNDQLLEWAEEAVETGLYGSLTPQELLRDYGPRYVVPERYKRPKALTSMTADGEDIEPSCMDTTPSHADLTDDRLDAMDTFRKLEPKLTAALSDYDLWLVVLSASLGIDDVELAKKVGGKYETVKKARQRAIRKVKALYA